MFDKKCKERKEVFDRAIRKIIARQKFLNSVYIACPYTFSLVKNTECMRKCNKCWMKANYSREKLSDKEEVLDIDKISINDKISPNCVLKLVEVSDGERHDS